MSDTLTFLPQVRSLLQTWKRADEIRAETIRATAREIVTKTKETAEEMVADARAERVKLNDEISALKATLEKEQKSYDAAIGAARNELDNLRAEMKRLIANVA